MERRLTSLLNACESENLPAADQRELSSLITDNFVSDGSDPEWSDDECWLEPSVEIHSRCLSSMLILHRTRLSINNSQIAPQPPPNFIKGSKVNHFALTEYYMFFFAFE